MAWNLFTYLRKKYHAYNSTFNIHILVEQLKYHSEVHKCYIETLVIYKIYGFFPSKIYFKAYNLYLKIRKRSGSDDHQSPLKIKDDGMQRCSFISPYTL